MKMNALNGLMRSLAAMFIVLAISKSNNISLVTVVSKIQIIIVILLSAIFLKEHQKMKSKLTISLVATFGLAVIFWK